MALPLHGFYHLQVSLNLRATLLKGISDFVCIYFESSERLEQNLVTLLLPVYEYYHV
jgi:hypothetical protein